MPAFVSPAAPPPTAWVSTVPAPTPTTAGPSPGAPVSAIPLGPVTVPPAAPTVAPTLGTKAMAGNATLAAIAKGTAPALIRGAPKSSAVELVQLGLYSSGKVDGIADVDGRFGPRTETAILAFQVEHGLAPTGKIDAELVRKLDQTLLAQIEAARAAERPAGERKASYSIVVDLSDLANTRLYVVGADGAPVARYLTSPGKAPYLTKGDSFSVRRVLPRKAWVPPPSPWAAGLSTVPPGLSNPMGILKLDLGAYTQYIHGIPAAAEKDLGKAASHGCLRMSGSNILELHERYAEAGTKVKIVRDGAKSAALAAGFAETGEAERPITAGREYLFGYVSGELGKTTSM